MPNEFVLDPSRTYSAVEVQTLLNGYKIKELRVDLDGVIKLTDITSKQIETLVREMRELKTLVGTQEMGFAEFGTASLSTAEKASLPRMIRAFQVGQAASAEEVEKRERYWRRIATVAAVSAVMVSLAAASGVFQWIDHYVIPP